MRLALTLLLAATALPAQQYDLLLKGGHVIDPKNRLDSVRDVAISAGRIARVAESIAADTAGNADAMYRELLANAVPNSHVVSAGVLAVNRA